MLKRFWQKLRLPGLLEFGVERSVVTEKWNQVNAEREFQTNPIRVVAGLNNADIAGVQLEVLKADPKKVMEGMAIAALAVMQKKCICTFRRKKLSMQKNLRQRLPDTASGSRQAHQSQSKPRRCIPSYFNYGCTG